MNLKGDLIAVLLGVSMASAIVFFTPDFDIEKESVQLMEVVNED